MNNTIIPHFVFWIWILVILAKKRNFLVVFILTPPIFRWKTDKLPKKSGQLPNITQNPSQKNFGGHSTKIDAKNPKTRPPPLSPIGEGLILKLCLCDVFYWAWLGTSLQPRIFKGNVIIFKELFFKVFLYTKSNGIFLGVAGCL